MTFTSVFYTGPVTALHAVSDNQILAGIGSMLCLFRIDTQTCTHSREVLSCRNVHGIREKQDGDTGGGTHKIFCVFGQKSFVIVDLDLGSDVIGVMSDQTEVEDWIWDVTWLQRSGDEPQCLAIALGHNVILQWDLNAGTVLQKFHCEERCILYCAKFLTDSWDSLILAAGTVFNQVVLWSPQRRAVGVSDCTVFHRLSGHQGVIFSICYCSKSRRICSVSDDRSIRLYELHFQTGSGESFPVGDAPSLGVWQTVQSSLLYVLYGHMARVWDAKLLSDKIISVGEDAACCVWNYNGDMIKKFKGHKGRSIWSLAADRNEKFVVSGGGDTSIRVWNLNKDPSEGMSDLDSCRLLYPQISAADYPRIVKLVDFNNLLVITYEGLLLLHHIVGQSWTTLMSDPSFQSYSVLDVSPCSHFITVGNIAGVLRTICIQEDGSTWKTTMTADKVICQGKIFDITWIAEDTFLTSQPNGIVTMWQINLTSGGITLEEMHVLELPPSKQRWISAAALSVDGTTIVCGDRDGSVLVYQLHKIKQAAELVQSFPKIHGKTGVTHVCFHGNQVYTSGRDGHFRQYCWQNKQLLLLNSNRVCKGFEWIDKVMITEEGETIIHGFHNNKFVVWSVEENQRRLEIQCGGGHRAWDYLQEEQRTRFTYIKSRRVFLQDSVIADSQVQLKGSLHGRELCDVHHLASLQLSGEPVHVLVTCSEDTNIALVALSSNSHGIPVLNVLKTVYGHISSVRCLAVCHRQLPVYSDLSTPSQTSDSTSRLVHNRVHSLLLFSGGGRAELKAWRLHIAETNQGTSHIQVDMHGTGRKYNSEDNISKGNLDETSVQDKLVKDSESGITKELTETDEGIQSYRNNCGPDVKTETVGHARKSRFGTDCDMNLVDEVDCRIESLAGIQLISVRQRRVKKPWKHSHMNSDPETRILDLSVTSACDINKSYPAQVYFIVAACSDAAVRFFAFDEAEHEFYPLASSSFHDHCVLKVKQIIHTAHTKQKPVTLSAGTDGRVAFWDCTQLYQKFMDHYVSRCDQIDDDFDNDSPSEDLTQDSAADDSFCDSTTQAKNERSSQDHAVISPCFYMMCHQSGINSLQISSYKDDLYIVVTGGDDNSLMVSVISVCDDNPQLSVHVVHQAKHLTPHAAQITGSWILSPFTILTASIDQRVCLWDIIESPDESIQIKQQDCKFVSTADISNLTVWNHRDSSMIALCGEGLEVLAGPSFSSKSSK